MFIVTFQNTDDLDLMKWSIGPYETHHEAETARLNFIDEMDQIDEFSAVWAGEVTELLRYQQVVNNMGEALRKDRENNDI